jgi:hypothetical protein
MAKWNSHQEHSPYVKSSLFMSHLLTYEEMKIVDFESEDRGGQSTSEGLVVGCHLHQPE